MYQIETGEKFFNEYCVVNNYTGTPIDFLKDILFPLLYVKDRHLMYVANNPFFQAYIKYKKNKDETLVSEKAPNKYVNYIKKGDVTMRTMVGGFSSDASSATYCQTGEFNALTPYDSCFSYIGETLTFGVNGGLSIATFNPKLLLKIFEGIKLYREFVDDNSDFADKQLKTWNSIYLLSICSNNNINVLLENYSNRSKNIYRLNCVNWVDFFINLSKSEYDIDCVSVSKLGKTNETFGLIPVDLNGIRSFYEFYEKIFSHEYLLEHINIINEYLSTSKFFEKYLKEYKIGVNIMCQNDIKNKEYDEIFNNNKKIFAMIALNDKTLFDSAKEFSEVLFEYKSINLKSRNTNENKVKSFLTAKNKIDMIKSLSEIMVDLEKEGDKEYIMYVAGVINGMDFKNLKYFITLIDLNIKFLTK